MDFVARSYVVKTLTVLCRTYENAWFEDDLDHMSERGQKLIRTVVPKAIKALTIICRKAAGELPRDPPACSTQVGQA